ncbi:hypothetical protein [Campylobacter troglodytis]|uniref:hypothetical protein n=1 Tax=Campylobacter troglodytis TaxID=654363 RepID=UPI001158C73B|nr:hypothetical protein [Campylobacter troglodytis]TQR60457.1 hypothetical protein DMC01_05625 [Campylobacter troglodytis]
MTTIKSIKTKAIIALILSVFALLPYVGVLFTIAFYAVMLFAIKGVKELSSSPTVLRNFLIFVGLMILSVVLENYFSSSKLGSALEFAATGDSSSIFSGVFMDIVKIVVALAGVIFGFFYYKELSRLSDRSLFIVAYIFVLLDQALTVLWMGWISWVFALLAFIFELIAWIKLDHINKVTVENI